MKPQHLLMTATLLMVGCADTFQESEKATPEIKKAEATPEPEKEQVEKIKDTKPARSKGEVTEVSIEQVFQLKAEGKALLIDTRPPIYFALGHIDGAENFPLKNYSEIESNLESRVSGAEKSGKIIITYCANEQCPDSFKMADKIASNGHNVSVYKGGWDLWKKAGLDD